ncbi:MAG: molybdopterin cofactor-binding domain-containing protein [Byssovorax sp.]
MSELKRVAPPVLLPTPSSGLIGTRTKALLAPRITGQVRYTDDLHLPRMLWGRLLRCPHPHARIVKIDASRALAKKGVIAVITGRDMPERFGIIPWTPDEFPLALEKARFVGDAVAAVAATDERLAHEAAELIDVEYELLPAATDLDTAINKPSVGLGKGEKDNVSKEVDLAFGDVDALLAGSDAIVEGDYYYEGSAHVPIETHCALAQMDKNGLLTVWSATQVPHYLHRELSRVLRLSPARIRVIQPPIGGAFGGKSEPFSLEFCAAKLAMVTGRPVKFLYTREEEFYAHRGRHPMRMHMKVGATKDGKLTAVDALTSIDGGAYSSFGLVTAYYSGQLLTLPAFAQGYRFKSTRYFTNKPPCGPKRGHGSVQPRFAFEVSLDKIAEQLSLDPIELRRRNLVEPNARTINGMRVTSSGITECLDKVEHASRWKERRGKLPYGKGLGVAASAYISGTNYCIYPNAMPQSGSSPRSTARAWSPSSPARARSARAFDTLLGGAGGRRIGPGSRGGARPLATRISPVDLGAYSSRGTFMNGNAKIHAARCAGAAEASVAAVAEKFGVGEKEIPFVTRGALCVAADPTKSVPVTEAIQPAEGKFGTLGATGYYNTPELGGDYRGGDDRRLARLFVHRACG